MLKLSHIWLAGASSSWLQGPSDKLQWSLSTSLLSGKKRCLRLTCVFPLSALGSAILELECESSKLASELFCLDQSQLCDLGPVPFCFLSQTFFIRTVGEQNPALTLDTPQGVADTKPSFFPSFCLHPHAGGWVGRGCSTGQWGLCDN